MLQINKRVNKKGFGIFQTASWSIFGAVFCILLSLLSSCKREVVYHQYRHTSVAGWERNETVSFAVPPVLQSGDYTAELGLRINSSYPFMGLSLIVEQTVLPEHRTRIDTLHCQLIDEKGNPRGQGISYYQYAFHVSDLSLSKGDSLQVIVKHYMKREILPGISDVGFALRTR